MAEETCTASEANPSVRYLTAGSPIPPDAFEALQWGPEDGTTRLRRRLLTTADGFSQEVFTPWLWDSHLETGCRPQLADDGYLRCLPSAVLVWDLFMDPDCTQREAVAARYRHACEEPTAPAHAARERFVAGEGCDLGEFQRDLYGVGEKIDGVPYLHSPLSDECVPYALPEAPIVVDFYRLGARIDPERFERVVYSVD